MNQFDNFLLEADVNFMVCKQFCKMSHSELYRAWSLIHSATTAICEPNLKMAHQIAIFKAVISMYLILNEYI